jgi:hypothetical protein
MKIDKSLEVVWLALNDYRENLIPPGDSSYTAQWNEIKKAMKSIEAKLQENIHANDLRRPRQQLKTRKGGVRVNVIKGDVSRRLPAEG